MNGSNSFEGAALFLIACSVKVTFVLGVAWLIASATRGRSAAFRHSIWAAAVLGTLALPLFSLLMPKWHSTALGNAAAVWKVGQAVTINGGVGKIPVTAVDAALTAPTAGKWAGLVLLLWGIGFCVFAGRFIAGLLGLARVASSARVLDDKESREIAEEIRNRMGARRHLRLLQSDQAATMPVTWGALRPTILLPVSATKWPVDRKRSVMSHEIAHIARIDWLFQMLAEFMRAVYWFHPFAWGTVGRLRRESECACDDAVLNFGVDASGYANALLDLARTLKNPSRSWSAALAIARPTNLERRFKAMLNPSVNRKNLSRGAKALLMFAAMCVLIPLAALRLPAQSTGKFSGIISDPSGMPVANATVIMDNHKANGIQMTTSDAGGKYSFVALPAGEYEVRITKPGFAEFRAKISSLDSGHDSPHNDIMLQIGGVNEEIDVIADGGPKEGIKQGVQGGVAGGAAGGVASDSSAKTIRLRIGGEVQAPKIIEKVPPVYPEKAKAAGIDGKVILHAIISKDGNPLSLRVMNNQIDPDLARAAVEAVSKWRYKPTLLNGDPVEVDTTIMVNFTLMR